MKIEVGKFYKTRDGLKVRIYSTDGLGTFCIHGAVYIAHEIEPLWGWESSEWDQSGKSIYASKVDIISEWNEGLKSEVAIAFEKPKILAISQLKSDANVSSEQLFPRKNDKSLSANIELSVLSDFGFKI